MEEKKLMSSGFIVGSMDIDIDVDLRENELRKLSTHDEKFKLNFSFNSTDSKPKEFEVSFESQST